MTAARCPRCRRRDVRVRKDGRLAVHYVTIPVSARAVPSVGAGSVKRRCDGSEQPSSKERSKPDPDLPRHAADCAIATTHHLTCTCGALMRWRREHEATSPSGHRDGGSGQPPKT